MRKEKRERERESFIFSSSKWSFEHWRSSRLYYCMLKIGGGKRIAVGIVEQGGEKKYIEVIQNNAKRKHEVSQRKDCELAIAGFMQLYILGSIHFSQPWL